MVKFTDQVSELEARCERRGDIIAEVHKTLSEAGVMAELEGRVRELMDALDGILTILTKE